MTDLAAGNKGSSAISNIVSLQEGNFAHIRDRTRLLDISPTKIFPATLASPAHRQMVSRKEVKNHFLLGVGASFHGLTPQSGLLINPFLVNTAPMEAKAKTHRKQISVGDSSYDCDWHHTTDRSGSTQIDYLRVMGNQDSVQDDESNTAKKERGSGFTLKSLIKNKSVSEGFEMIVPNRRQINLPKKRGSIPCTQKQAKSSSVPKESVASSRLLSKPRTDSPKKLDSSQQLAQKESSVTTGQKHVVDLTQLEGTQQDDVNPALFRDSSVAGICGRQL
jgi:hypothetical protein